MRIVARQGGLQPVVKHQAGFIVVLDRVLDKIPHIGRLEIGILQIPIDDIVREARKMVRRIGLRVVGPGRNQALTLISADQLHGFNNNEITTFQ
jgi:hypothetical protein